MTKNDFKIEREDWMYRGFLSIKQYLIKHRLFAGGWSSDFTREVVIRTHAAGAIPYDPVLDKVVLIQQFRMGALEDPISPWLYEVVAGLMDANETPEQVVLREIQEEAGIAALELLQIYGYWASPGAANEFFTLYCARVDASNAGGFHGLPEEHEDIRVIVVDAAAAFQMLKEGQIRNATAIIALQWLELNHQSLRKKWLAPKP